ncbi:MAG: hypothetical protein MJY64_01145 [archaeon]|nr:hypothetical protein [archaeon]
MSEIYKVTVSIPEKYVEKLMDEIDLILKSSHNNYRRCFYITDCTGTWIPQKGSSPYVGAIGEKEYSKEKKVEFVVKDEDIKAVLRKISEVHPYEEPAIDVIACIDWKSLI